MKMSGAFVVFCRELSAAAHSATDVVDSVDKDGEIASESREQSLPLTMDDIVFVSADIDNDDIEPADNSDNAAAMAAASIDNDKTATVAADDDVIGDKDLSDLSVKFAVTDDEPICDKPSDEKSSVEQQNLIDGRPLQQPPAASHG